MAELFTFLLNLRNIALSDEKGKLFASLGVPESIFPEGSSNRVNKSKPTLG